MEAMKYQIYFHDDKEMVIEYAECDEYWFIHDTIGNGEWMLWIEGIEGQKTLQLNLAHEITICKNNDENALVYRKENGVWNI